MSRKYFIAIVHKTLAAFAITILCIHHGARGQEQINTINDRDGNVYTVKKMPDNKNWMTDNLNINIPGSYCYDNVEQNCIKYGRLYTWETAREGCRILGEGWRLPTNEEWQQMAKSFGGVRDVSSDSGKAAYKALIHGGKSEFNVVFGGGRFPGNGEYARMEAHGFYWTATESDTATAWFYNLGKGGQILNRHQDGEKQIAISVRCIF